MVNELLLSLALLYVAACFVLHSWAARRGTPNCGWLLAWLLLLGWTGWGALAAIAYILACGRATPRGC